jgi:septum formation protein
VTTGVVLASRSATRIKMLENAGLVFSAEPSTIDERAVEAPLLHRQAAAIALALAEAKARDVAQRRPANAVIGADQTMELAGQRFNKPGTRQEAAEQLAVLSGATHHLHTAAVIISGEELIWQHSVSARLTMRVLSPAAIEHYLDTVGDSALTSVGGYQIEGPGIQLFEEIAGDYFAILGLPLLPLLTALRHQGALAR